MPAPSTSRDPRSFVTPDAFHVSPDLLGLPLALPRRRLAAVLLDLVFIGIVTVVTRSFALALGVVIAGALMRAGFLRTEVTGNVFDRARRASIGLLGLTVGLVTLGIWVAGGDRGGESSTIVIRSDSAGIAAGPVTAPEEELESRDAQAVRDGVTLYTVEQALERYATLRRRGTRSVMDEELLRALEARLATEVASDTLLAMREQIEGLRNEARDAQLRLERAETELDARVSGGALTWFSDLLDDLGFGFGWAALYMTVWMSMTNGQTLGKRLLGIRVVRLDGERITWWVAFERAGGYAAGFATGLLGFAQILWDANRQGIHDRIVGTVVVRDGLKRPVEDHTL